MDGDVTRAMDETAAVINQSLFSGQQTYTIGFLYLSAHNLVMNIRASSQGLSGQFSWLENSKSVGNVSEGFTIPDRILENPQFAIFAKTNYGMKYLAMIWPYLRGQMFTVCGMTNP